MRFLFFVLVVGQSAWAQSIRVANPAAAKATSYTTAELDGVLSHWIIHGEVVEVREVRERLHREKAIACAAWMMNHSADKSISKAVLQERLLASGRALALWKNVGGRPIYVDTENDYSLSFVCVSEDANGQPIEIDSTDFVKMWTGVYIFEQ